MKIREILFASALLLSATFASCDKNEVTPSNKEQTRTIAFAIAIPKGDPVTYAIHDDKEWTMGSLWMYEFNADGSKLLVDAVDIAPDLQVNGTAPNYTYQRQITTADKGTRRFVFVANEKPENISVANNSSLSDLEAKLAQKVLADDGSSKDLLQTVSGQQRIPMTGVATQSGSPVIAVTGSISPNNPIKVDMTRIVARIDVKVHAPNLEVTDLKLINTNSHSHLFLNGDYKTPDAENTKVNNIGTFADVTSFDPDKLLKKAFYLYEGHQRANNSASASQDDAVKVVVFAKLGGVPVVYTIPFWKDGKEVVVKRNYLYRLELGEEGTPVEPNTTVTFAIKVLDWNEILLNETYDVLSAEYLNATGATYAKEQGKMQGTLSVDKDAHNDLKFAFTNQYQNHHSYVAKIVGTVDWLTADFNGNELTITTQENTTGAERSADITINSDVDSDTHYVISVKQAAN